MGLKTTQTCRIISELENRARKTIYLRQRGKEKAEKTEQRISELWDNITQSNTHVIRVPEGEEKEKLGERNYF